MTQEQTNTGSKQGTPGAFSRWMQHRMNARTNRKIRGGKGKAMGMDVLILNTVGRQSGEPRETPLAWFEGTDNSRYIVASGGGSQNPDWHANLMGNPDKVTIELAGENPTPVTPHQLDGAERDKVWERIAVEAPNIAKYQAKSDRIYPVIRLTTG